jgi:hypothetical protein
MLYFFSFLTLSQLNFSQNIVNLGDTTFKVSGQKIAAFEYWTDNSRTTTMFEEIFIYVSKDSVLLTELFKKEKGSTVYELFLVSSATTSTCIEGSMFEGTTINLIKEKGLKEYFLPCRSWKMNAWIPDKSKGHIRIMNDDPNAAVRIVAKNLNHAKELLKQNGFK